MAAGCYWRCCWGGRGVGAAATRAAAPTTTIRGQLRVTARSWRSPPRATGPPPSPRRCHHRCALGLGACDALRSASSRGAAAGEASPAPARAEVAEFAELSGAALLDGSLVKGTLSRYRGREAHLKSAHFKAVELKGGSHLQILLRYKFRDVTKNYPASEAATVVMQLLASGFSLGNLYTISADWHLVVPKKAAKAAALTRSGPTSAALPDLSHDREKPSQVPRGAPFLQALGVSDATGKPRPGMASKLRQVDRFCEVLGHAVQGSAVVGAPQLRVVDMGAGKGYLTFATHAFLAGLGGAPAREVVTTGVEVREDLVAAGNRTAAELDGFAGLSFRQGTIAQWSREQGVGAGEAGAGGAGAEDVLIALHACDTATDDALFYGMQSGASVILTSPCCHKELRRQLREQEATLNRGGTGTGVSPMGAALQDVLRHGILAERQAELLTDSLRACLLEAAGYEASVFEYVSGEHTAKNLMICAVKRKSADGGASEGAAERAVALLAQFGIKHQRLAALMGYLEPSKLVSF